MRGRKWGRGCDFSGGNMHFGHWVGTVHMDEVTYSRHGRAQPELVCLIDDVVDILSSRVGNPARKVSQPGVSSNLFH